MKHLAVCTLLLAASAATPLAAQNRIDGQSPDAPALSAYGNLPVGVRQIQLVNPGQVDILALDPTQPAPSVLPLYDRPLTVEVWYPAAQGATGDTKFETLLRDGTTTVMLEGKAMRDAAAATGGKPAPLLLLSHGYPGNRFLMSHFAENLASKGYVVASIDHTDSTYADQRAFGSTLVNRPLDQLFVLDELARLNNDASSVFAGKIDTDNTALLGYSMGGYGAIVTAGGGVTTFLANVGAPFGTLGIHEAGSATHEALPDPRIKTAIAIGPCCNNFGFWDAAGLAGIETPMLFIAGSNDQTSGYENGVRKIWEQAVNADRALLTFDGGSHNTVAPIPAPVESFGIFAPQAQGGFEYSEHYSDPVWDTVFMNNVGQHFLTSWLDTYLKGKVKRNEKYLDLTANGSDGIWSVNPDGTFKSDHTHWFGFQEDTADGIRFEVAAAAPSPVPLPASGLFLGLALGGLGLMRRRRAKAS
jgi:predicted dienelactone hydrolase